MPLTPKGEEIKENMQKEYGPKKGESVFYASANKGTIKGVHNDRSDQMSNDAPYVSGPNTGATATGAKQPPGHAAKPLSKEDQEHLQRIKSSKDVETPKPASGPMATGGPVGTSENLPKTTEPFKDVPKAADSSPAMSMDAIKAMGKRIGRY
jgi:hypothetical protein